MDSNSMNSNPVQITPGPMSKTEGNKMVLWLVLGLVIILMAVGGVYWYLAKKQSSSTNETQPTITNQKQPTPAPDTTESIDNELNSIDVKGVDSDFDSIDADLQNL